MLEAESDVIAAYPDGASSKVEIRVSKGEALTLAGLQKLIDKHEKFTLLEFATTVEAKKPEKKEAAPKNGTVVPPRETGND